MVAGSDAKHRTGRRRMIGGLPNRGAPRRFVRYGATIVWILSSAFRRCEKTMSWNSRRYEQIAEAVSGHACLSSRKGGRGLHVLAWQPTRHSPGLIDVSQYELLYMYLQLVRQWPHRTSTVSRWHSRLLVRRTMNKSCRIPPAPTLSPQYVSEIQ